MTKEKKNVFEQLQDSLAIMTEQLTNANDALYVVATTTIDLSDKLDTLSAKLDAILGEAKKTVEKKTETPAPKIVEPVKFSFEKLRQERK